MAINRAPYNALVDDDGSGTTGTPWNKAQIKGVLLDPIDALVGSGQWTPRIIADGGGTPAYSLQSGVWAKSDKIALVSGRVTLSSKGALSGGLHVGPFPTGLVNPFAMGAVHIGYFGGLAVNAAMVAGYTVQNGSDAWLTYVPGGGATAAGTLYASSIADNFDLIFSVVYVLP